MKQDGVLLEEDRCSAKIEAVVFASKEIMRANV